MVKAKCHALEFHITGRCNIRCKYCCAGSPVRTDEVPKEDVFNDIQKSAEYFNPNVVLVIGGETFLHAHWFEITGFAADYYKCPVAVCTNGLILQQYLPDIVRLQNKYPQIYVRHSAYPFLAEKTAENIAFMQKYNVNYKIIKETYFQPIQIEILKQSGKRTAWKSCICKHCRSIYRGRLYKCARMSDYAALQFTHLRNGKFVKQSYKSIFSESINSIDIHNTNINEIQNMFAEDEVDACGFCNAEKTVVEHQTLSPEEYNTLLKTLTEEIYDYGS